MVIVCHYLLSLLISHDNFIYALVAINTHSLFNLPMDALPDNACCFMSLFELWTRQMNLEPFCHKHYIHNIIMTIPTSIRTCVHNHSSML